MTAAAPARAGTAAYLVLPVSIRISARYGYVAAVLTMSDFSRDHHRPEAPLLSAGPSGVAKGVTSLCLPSRPMLKEYSGSG